jgi:hypothetical protein
MNHKDAWNYTIDMLDDSPLGKAAEQCTAIGYDDKPSNRTFTILAPNPRISEWVDTPAITTHLKSFLQIFDSMELKLVVQVENPDNADDSEYPVFGGWGLVLKQLKTESPRSAFDTWIRETWPVGLSGGILTVGARNSYAADWLNQRVRERAGELSSELLGEAVTVNFVVDRGTQDDDAEIEDKPQAEESSDDPGNAPGKNIIEPVNNTAYATEVNPSRVVAFPGYALRLMWHGDLSPKEMSLWMSFRQAVWSNWKQRRGTVRNIPHQEIVSFAMMSSPSYFREIRGVESIAGGLVEEVPSEWHPGPTNPHLDNARRWRVRMQPRLTRRDCNAIHAILYRATSDAGSVDEAIETAAKALEVLARLSPGDYLDDHNNQEIPISGWPKGVAEIARRAIGFQGDMPESLHKAVEKLEDKIISAYGQVVIPHYFLQVTVPELGLSQAQAWTIISLRDMCYYDHVNQKPYSFAILRGGMQQLAGLTGSTIKSVRNWLKDPAFLEFITIEDTNNFDFPADWGTACMVVDVRENEPTADERKAFKAAVSQEKMITNREKVINGSEKNDQRVGKKRSMDWEKMINGLGKNDQRLNNFIKPQLNPIKPQESPQTPRQKSAQKPGQVGSRAFWDWDALMSQNSVSMPMSKKLLIANKSAGQDISHLCQKFVSWVLYGYSEAGRGLSNPVSNALARLKENTYAGAGGDFDALAALSPNTLRAFIDLDLSGRDLPENHHGDAYAFNFDRLPEPDKRELRQRLFGL